MLVNFQSQASRLLVSLVACALFVAACSDDLPLGPSSEVVDPPNPQEPSRQIFTIPGKVYSLCPNWDLSDLDFSGRGPKVEIVAELKPAVAGNNLQSIAVHFSARETRADWTSAHGDFEHTIATLPAGWSFDGFIDEYSFALRPLYADSDREQDCFQFPSGLISQICVIGDTKSDDAGSCAADDTRITVHEYRQVRVWIKQRPADM